MNAVSKKPVTPRPRTPKGYRPNNLGDPHVERVLSITMAVATELSALHDKVDTLARLASTQKSFTMADLEGYQPSPEIKAEREMWRKEYLKRLLRILWEDIPENPNETRSTAYGTFVREISE